MEWLSSFSFFGLLRGLVVLLEAVMVLNLLIVVHEWGHFLAARWRGLKIEKFYVWFGKPLWKKTFNGVEYGLGSIPLGGFVQLPQMGPMGGLEGEEEKAEKLPQVTPLDKIIVAFAGPLFSFLLAVVFAWMVYGIGMPDRRVRTTVIGWIDPTSKAAETDLKPGDKILEIDGVPVTTWDEPINSVRERIAFSKGDKIEFTVLRPGETTPRKIASGFKVKEGTLTERRGLRTAGLAPKSEAQVYELLKGSAGERAGLKKGDIITHLNGAPVFSDQTIYTFFQSDAAKSATLTVSRDGKPQEVTLQGVAPVTPAKVPEFLRGLTNTGIRFESAENGKEVALVHPTPSAQLSQASTMMFRTFGAVFSTRGDVGFQQMGGPVKIISTYTQLFKIPDGWRLVLWFSVILNVNLAIMNLFPFPVFDGGHIVMGIGEMIRRGSLLPAKIMEGVQYACVITLLCFFVYVTWFDANDLIGHDKGKDKEPDFKIEDVTYPVTK